MRLCFKCASIKYLTSKILCKLLIVFITILPFCYTYKILGIFSTPTGSHNILASKLFKELARKGHDVTYITPYPSKNSIKNLKEIVVEELQQLINPQQAPKYDLENANPFKKSQSVLKLQVSLSKTLLKNQQVQELLKSEEKFDVVILYYYLNDALVAMAHQFNAPVILLKSMPLYVSESFLLSHPTPSSYIPNILTEYTGRMNFWQRLRNSFYDVIMILHYQWVMLPQHQQLAQEYLPTKPNVYDFIGKESLLLINSHVSTNEATPIVPNAVEIGGFHIEEPKPFPEHLQKFMDESTNGVILFSMGSISRSMDFPKEKIDAILKTFSKLKENVLWKYEDENLAGLPKNVKIMKWIPQSDVLAHRNTKAFISHGGLLSTMESVYHGVPIIGIPVFTDQKMNIALATLYEYAIAVSYQELNEETLTAALEQILNNPKYKRNIQTRSKIMKDRPIKPIDNALYFIEYVIRHQGAPHLRYPGKDLNWLQRNLIDIVAFVGVVTIFSLFLLKTAWNCLLKKTKQKKE